MMRPTYGQRVVPKFCSSRFALLMGRIAIGRMSELRNLPRRFLRGGVFQPFLILNP